MLRKILSFLIIISILCPDIARAMDEERGSPQKSSRHRPSFYHPQLQKNTTPDIFDDEQTEVYQTSEEESVEDNSSLASQNDESFPPPETPPIAGMVAAAFGFPGSPPSGTELKHWTHYSKSRGERFTIQDLPPLTQSHSLNDSDEEERLLEESIYLFPDDVSPKTRHFLEYLKDRVIDGKPTLKQAFISGFLGSLIGGGMAYAGGLVFTYGVLWGIPCYSYLSFLKDSEILNDGTFGKGAMIFGSITLGLDSLSRNYKILAQFSAPSQPFLIKKSKTFKAKEIVLKSALYIAGIAASSIPLSCIAMIAFIGADNNGDIEKVFYPAAIPVLFDTALNYGYLLSQRVGSYLNQKFFHEWRSYHLSSPAELKRKDYLTELKNLKWMLYLADEDDIHDLYERVIVKCSEKSNQHDKKDSKLQDALRVLSIFQDYEKQQDFEKPTPAGWKSSVVTALGWGIPILATAARVLAFYAAVGDAIQSLDATYESMVPQVPVPNAPAEPNDLFKRNLLSQQPDDGTCITDFVTYIFSRNISPALLLSLKIILGGDYCL